VVNLHRQGDAMKYGLTQRDPVTVDFLCLGGFVQSPGGSSTGRFYKMFQHNGVDGGNLTRSTTIVDTECLRPCFLQSDK